MNGPAQTELFLETAAQIGQLVVREAVWHANRCSWVGVVPNERNRLGPGSMVYHALGPSFYDGTSGVALFLAELHAATGEAAFRRAALGAIRQALSLVDSLPAQGRLGLFTGWTGIAFAAARAGTLLDEPALLGRAAELLRRCRWDELSDQEFDLISGGAGAITALLALEAPLADGALLDAATQLGDKLARTAEASQAGSSWRGNRRFEARNLTGLSHGASGAAYALLELFHASGDTRYRDLAQQALRYERFWFDAEAANWPDFRKEPEQRARRAQPPTFASFWCHGAPGIALVRLRAYTLLRDETCKAEAVAALQTTHRTVAMWLQSDRGNYSLCHGLAGNAEVLLQGRQILGPEADEHAQLAHQVAENGVSSYGAGGRPWPCGTHGGDTPGLMLGLAGIGLFFLRLYNPHIPSILVLQREMFVC